MKHSDNDPRSSAKSEQGDAMTDDLAPAAQDDNSDALESEQSERPNDVATDDRARTSASDATRALAEQQDKYLRLAAEYDNYRKRTVRERQEASLRGQAELLRALLDALDDL